MKLVMVIPALTAGGAERVMTIMANYWAQRGWNIVIITLDDGTASPFFTLHERVRHRPLALTVDSTGLVDALRNNLRRLLELRRALRAERPDAVISFLDSTNVLTLLATRRLGVPVIVSEHIDPRQYDIKLAWRLLRRWVYPCADKITVLTQRVLDFFPPALHAKLVVMPNPVVPPPASQAAALPLPAGPWVMAMGRFTEQKGFDLLLRAFAALPERHALWRVVIVGEGPLRVALEDLRDCLGLTDRILLPGRVSNPEAALKQADLFVLPSRFEGFPMALCEAMAAGLPVIAADCPTGPREIIRPDVDGILIPPEDPAALAAALARLMDDDALRQRLGGRAAEIVDRFGVDRIMAMWEAIVADALAEVSLR